MQYFAVIDIGSNSTRMLVARFFNDKILPCRTYLRTTRLGGAVEKGGRLTNKAMSKTIGVLKEYLGYLSPYKEISKVVIATSAVREASNKTEFLERVKKETCLDVRILTGKEEALFSYWGATNEFREIENPLVIDVGGGSTEISFKEKENVHTLSKNLGSVVCTENKLTYSDILNRLEPELLYLKNFKETQLIGTGGTVTTLAAVDQKLACYDPQKVHSHVLRKDKIKKMYKAFSRMSLEERKKVTGLQPDRADIIVAGTMIVLAIMDLLDKDKIIVSESDLLHGAIWNEISKSN